MNKDRMLRQWWRLIEDLPAQLGPATVWPLLAPPPSYGEGRSHATPTLVACLAGVVRVRGQRRSIDLLPQEALLIGAGVWHHHETLRGSTVMLNLGFTPVHGDLTIATSAHSWRGRLAVHPCLALAVAAFQEQTLEQRRTHLVTLLRQVLAEPIIDVRHDDQALVDMLQCLAQRAHRGLTTADLIKSSQRSRARAYLLFTDACGMTPRRAIEMARILMAQSLLGYGYTFRQIAAYSGFPNRVGFSRAWKRFTGLAPRRTNDSVKLPLPRDPLPTPASKAGFNLVSGHRLV